MLKSVTIGSGIRFKTHISYPKLVCLRMPAPNVRQGIIFNVFSYLPINIFLNVQRFHKYFHCESAAGFEPATYARIRGNCDPMFPYFRTLHRSNR